MTTKPSAELLSTSTRLATSVHDVDPKAWDELVGEDNFYNSFGWLSGLEALDGEAPIFLVAEGEQLLAAAPSHWGPRTPNPYFDPVEMFPEFVGAWADCPMWLGARRAVGNEPLIRPGRSAPAKELLASAAAFAGENGGSCVIYPYLSSNRAQALADTHPNAVALLHSADAVVDVPPGGLTEFLARLTARRRSRFTREIRLFDEACYEVDCTPLSEVLAEVAPLLAQSQQKYQNDISAADMVAILEAQTASGVLDRGLAFTCRRDGKLVGAMVGYRYGRQFYSRYVGFDYSLLADAFEYFTLTYYEPFRRMPLLGLVTGRYAVSAYGAKVRRGAQLRPLSAVVVGLTSPVLSATQVADYNRTWARSWVQQWERFDALSPEWSSLADA